MEKKKTKYHHSDLRKKLIDEATRIIAEKGAGALTLRDLARRCGVSRTAPYRHFPDKSELLAAVAEVGFLELSAAIKKVRVEKSGDPVRAIEACLLAYVDFAEKQPAQYRLMFGRQIRSLIENPGLAASSSAAFEELVSVIRMGQEGGCLGQERTVELAYLLWSKAHGLSMLLIDGLIAQVGDVRRFIRFACRSFLVGIPEAWSEYGGPESATESRP
ncbi:MAG: TetR/AcrR family transcriptional regulator [Anaerolineales bacterium]|nr:TetR/AcrR family transcriptional regulator [Anaerolineales bacterium]